MVVVEGGGNHGQSLATPPNACVNGYLNRYLATGALPGQTGLVSATCPARCRPPEEDRAGASLRQMPLLWMSAAHQGVAFSVAAAADRSRSRRGARPLRSRSGHERLRERADPVNAGLDPSTARRSGLGLLRGRPADLDVLLGRQPGARRGHPGRDQRLRRAGPAAGSPLLVDRRPGRGRDGQLWSLLAPSWGRPRDIRSVQPVLAISGPARRASPIRWSGRSRRDELDVLLPSCIAMFTEEVGVSPIGPDGGVAYRARMSDLIRAGRSFARIEMTARCCSRPRSARSRRTACQVQGVWVPPDGARPGPRGAAAWPPSCRPRWPGGPGRDACTSMTTTRPARAAYSGSASRRSARSCRCCSDGCFGHSPIALTRVSRRLRQDGLGTEPRKAHVRRATGPALPLRHLHRAKHPPERKLARHVAVTRTRGTISST